MEKVFDHLARIEGEDKAKKLVHWMYSYLRIGAECKFDKNLIFELKEMVPMIGYQGCIDELAAMTRSAYPIDKFLEEINENEYDNIIMDFEKWDNRKEEQKFFEITKRCLKQ